MLNHINSRGKQLFCTFIDLSKSFDYVNRDDLWLKLIQLGPRGNVLNIIRSMLIQLSFRDQFIVLTSILDRA